MVYKRGRMTTIFIIAVVLVALIAVGTLAFSLLGMNSEIADEHSEGEEENLRDAVMEYIKLNHPDAAVLIKDDMSWTGDRATPPKGGYERYIHTSDGWNITIGYAITAELMYEVKAEYDERIVWTGTVEDDVIMETGYTCNTNKTDADIQTVVMEYIKKNHPDAAAFIGEPSQMDWNKTSSEIKIGYSRYVYTSDGWNITVGYAITAELLYEVTADNKNEAITWMGTVQGETVTETGYSHRK